ncbi:MAG: hypothetical protein PVF45_01430 [Anaerolineae bacterium]|jgi:hypothetical protein
MKTQIAALIVCLVLVVPVLAQSTARHDLPWHVGAGGGGRMESTGHTLLGTVGQPLIGTMTSSGHALNSGFWYTEAVVDYRVYLPLLVCEFGSTR